MKMTALRADILSFDVWLRSWIDPERQVEREQIGTIVTFFDVRHLPSPLEDQR